MGSALLQYSDFCYHRKCIQLPPGQQSTPSEVDWWVLPSMRTWSWRPRLQLMFPMQDSCSPVTPLCSLPIRRPQVEKEAETGGTTKAVQSHFKRKESRQRTSRSCHTKVVYFIFKSAITGKKSQILNGKQKANVQCAGEAGSRNICSHRHSVFSLYLP